MVQMGGGGKPSVPELAQLGGEAWLREQIDRAALAPASD
jgi:hypothetical protein